MLQIPVAARLEDDESIVEERGVLQLVKALEGKRKALWDQMKPPGADSLPKSFSLLPHDRLQHAFVPYDSE